MSEGTEKIGGNIPRQKYEYSPETDKVNGGSDAGKAESARSKRVQQGFNYAINKEYRKSEGDQQGKQDEFDGEKIDPAMISSLLISVINKVGAANLKQVAQKLTNIEIRSKGLTRATNAETDKADKARAEQKKKETEKQTLEDVSLGFSVALTMVSMIALMFLTGGASLAIAAAVISGIMTGLEVANRIAKGIPTAEYTDAKGNKRHVEISISAAVDALTDEMAKDDTFFPASIDTKEEREKYLADYKMGMSIAISLAITVVTVVLSAGSVKQAMDGLKNAAGIAAKAVAGFKASVTATLETVETAGQVVTASVDAVAARKQYDIAVDKQAVDTAENKASAFSFQADLLSRETRQLNEAMSKQSESTKKQVLILKKVLDAIMEMEDKAIHV